VISDDYPDMARARASITSEVTLPEPRWPRNLDNVASSR
jgi:hypothetical protein